MDPTQWAHLVEAATMALMSAMATDAWTSVRSRAAKLLAGENDVIERAALIWLEDSRRGLLTLPPTERDQRAVAVRVKLDAMLRSRLDGDPLVVTELERIIDEVRAASDRAAPEQLTQHARATRGGRVYQAGGDIQISGSRGVPDPS